MAKTDTVRDLWEASISTANRPPRGMKRSPCELRESADLNEVVVKPKLEVTVAPEARITLPLVEEPREVAALIQ